MRGSYKDDTLMLFDRYGGLMVRNGSMVTLQADHVQCLQIASSTESSMWHVRLGHINTNTLKMMVNKDLVIGMPNVTITKETCVSCLLGKQTRKPFPQATKHRFVLLNHLSWFTEILVVRSHHQRRLKRGMCLSS